MLSPEMQAKVATWRQKAIAGTLSVEDMREAIVLLRSNRRSAAVSATEARRTKARKVVQSADDMLKDLGL